KSFKRLRNYAEKRSHCEAGSSSRSDLQLDAGHEVCELDDVGRQEVDRAGHLLYRHDQPGAEGWRRGAEAVQEGDRELQAATGSKEPARGRRELPGADRSSAGAADFSCHSVA